MIVIPPYQTAVSLFHKDGSVHVYATLAEAKKQLGLRWIAQNVGAHFREYRYTPQYFSYGESCPPIPGEAVYDERDYVMRDDFGQPLTHADFASLAPKRPYVYRWEMKYRLWNGEGPVPGSRKRRGGRHYCRRLRVVRTLRQSYPVYEDFEVAPRGHRSSRNLPDTRDGHLVAAREDRSWKRYRKTQYKMKKGLV